MRRNTTISTRSIVRWLREQEPTDVVGQPCTGSECLVATYIRDALDGENVFVQSDGYVTFKVGWDYHDRYASPTIRRLIQAFDTAFPKYAWVTAAEAQAFLAQFQQQEVAS